MRYTEIGKAWKKSYNKFNVVSITDNIACLRSAYGIKYAHTSYLAAFMELILFRNPNKAIP